MNNDISAALAEMDKVPVSRLEHPGEGSLDPASCRFLAAFIRATASKRVLEFGSGFSSLMIGREIETGGDNFLFSVDDSPELSSLAKENLENSGVRARSEFRLAPLRPGFYGARLLMRYGLPKGLLGALGPFDLALIDAPPYNDCICEAAFREAFPVVEPGGFIIIGEANRSAEAIRRWLRCYGDAAEAVLLEGIGEGLMVVEKFDDAEPAGCGMLDSLCTTLRTLRCAPRFLLAGGKK